MNLSKERLELKKKLEGKLTDNAPIKKEQKSVSKLVIPLKFISNLKISNNSEETSKSLNSSLSKSAGNLSSSHLPRKLSASLFKSNSIQTEDKPQVVSRGQSERKLSSKSFNSLAFDDVKLNSRPMSCVEDTTRSSNTFSAFLDTSAQRNAADTGDIPIIVGSIRKNSLPDNPATPDELSNIVHFVRSPKPSKKEEASTILHFNFAAKPDEFSEKLRKIPSLRRRGSRCAILVPEEAKHENLVPNNVETLSADFTTIMKKSDDVKDVKDVKEEDIYVNIDIFRRYYDSTIRIKCGPIKKNPIPSIRYSLIR